MTLKKAMKTNRFWIVIGGLLAVTLCTAILSAPHSAELATSPPVHIDNFTFTPEEMTIAPSTTVTWVNDDDIPHAIAATGKSFRSKALDTNDTFSFTFKEPGIYEYFCSLHPHMKGKVIVR